MRMLPLLLASVFWMAGCSDDTTKDSPAPTGVDADGDGYDTPSDCDDADSDVSPGAPESCNGVDDDCDAATIESSMNDCATGLTCAVPSGESIPRCVDPRDCSQFPCPVGLFCNAMNSCCTTGTPGCGTPLDCTTTGCAVGSRCLPDITGGTFSCVPFGAVGDSCVRPADCNSGRCYTRASLLLEGAGSICGTACCSDAQCEASQACWAPGTGARSCVPRALLPPTPPSACARETDCPGSVCGLHTFDVPGSPSGGHAMTCDVPGARTCGGTACPAGICISATECGTPCGRSMGECAFNIIDGPTEACVYYTLMDDRIITACGPAGGFFRQGDSCGGFLRPCIDGLCLSGHCADVCCSDADCPATTACTPYMNFGWEMRCLPRVAGPVP